MSVNGVLCIVPTTMSQRPAVTEQRWRRCSIGTGLRFCGMIELTCTSAFGTRSWPTSKADQNAMSCTTRPRCRNGSFNAE